MTVSRRDFLHPCRYSEWHLGSRRQPTRFGGDARFPHIITTYRLPGWSDEPLESLLTERQPELIYRNEPRVGAPTSSVSALTTSPWNLPARRLSDGFDPIWHHSQVETARAKRVEQLKSTGENRAYLYTAHENMLGGLNSFYLLVNKPEVYGSPPGPETANTQIVSGSFCTRLRGDFGWVPGSV